VIPRAHIVAWRAEAPWSLDSQVEQDLVLSRAITDMFGEPDLPSATAMRGGTVLHKILLRPPRRYSEDIDLVQTQPGPIGPLLDAIHRRLDPWLGRPQWKQGAGRVTLVYRFETEFEPRTPARLKVEINTREHFSVLGLVHEPFAVESPWHSGRADVVTYRVEELLGTKLRALYQRKKGRDLFDLAEGLERAPAPDPQRIVECFERYLEHDGLRVSRSEMLANLEAKLADPAFGRDLRPLLAPGVAFDVTAAASHVRDELIARMR
jgi:predicted nucleotidyltransferase component of viral defense system